MYEYFGNLPTVEMIAEILLKLNTDDKRQCKKETDREFRKTGNGKCIEAEQFWKWFWSN